MQEQDPQPGEAAAGSDGSVVEHPAVGGSAVEQAAVERWAVGRQLYLDNLKVVLVAAIIAIHGVLGYVGTEQWWSYADVQEVTLSPVVETLLLVVAAPFTLFMIPLLFLVAGLLTPGSLERKGAARFARDRMLRLGIPFLLFTLVLQPSLIYALQHPLGAADGSYWSEYLGDAGRLDTGPLWFVGVLLVFSLGYAALAWLRPDRPAVEPAELTARSLLWLVVAIVPPTFLVRLAYPFGSESGFTDLNLWEWPGCLALFGLGVVAARRGWLSRVPDPLHRLGRTLTLVAGSVLAAVFAAAAGHAFDPERLAGGWDWPVVVFAALEAVLSVFGSVWLLGSAQRRLDRRLRWVGPAVSRSAYGAFVLQGLALIGLAVALRPLGLPAEVKALVVAAGGIVGSFGLAWLLTSRVPGVGRVL
jgi:hypothetical protein